MECYVQKTVETDEVFWLPKNIFDENFDQNDYHFRDQQQVEPCYSSEWFDSSQNPTFFYPPSVHITPGGSTQFISGRHRTAVLFSEMKTIPMAFAKTPGTKFAERLNLKPLTLDEKIALPDLPIETF